MDRKHGPMWDMFENDKLVAYARRAKKAGWFVRISELNPSYVHEKIYIDEDVYPINFMNLMLSMHKKETP
jgi:hypothetical protein